MGPIERVVRGGKRYCNNGLTFISDVVRPWKKVNPKQNRLQGKYNLF